MNLSDLTAAQPSPRYRPGSPSMHDVAAALHALRKDHGQRKYRSLLNPGNGRSAPIDRVQESLDGLVYDIQMVCEWQAMVDALAELGRRLRMLANDGASAADSQDAYRELMAVDALAARADAIAADLLGQATGSDGAL